MKKDTRNYSKQKFEDGGGGPEGGIMPDSGVAMLRAEELSRALREKPGALPAARAAATATKAGRKSTGFSTAPGARSRTTPPSKGK